MHSSEQQTGGGEVSGGGDVGVGDGGGVGGDEGGGGGVQQPPASPPHDQKDARSGQVLDVEPYTSCRYSAADHSTNVLPTQNSDVAPNQNS